MATFGFLLLTDLKKLKNYIFEIKKKPWKLLLYILYIAWMIFILFTAFRADIEPGDVLTNIDLKTDIISAIIKAFVLIIFSYTLYSGTKEFGGLFTMGDVNFLFPSPISPRKILAYSMMKQSLLLAISGIFILFLFPMIQQLIGPLTTSQIFYSLFGIIILFVFTIPLSYLSFVLSTRFGMKQWLVYFLYAILLFVVSAIGYGIFIHQDIVQGILWVFNNPLYSYIPIIGWSAELIGVSILGKTSLSTLILIMQLSTFVIITFLSVYLAQDYYEYAIPTAEKRAEVRRKSKEGKKVSISDMSTVQKKVRQVHVRDVGHGPWAFLWMQLITNKRSSGSLFFHWKTIGVLLISIAFGIFLPEKTNTSFYIVAGAISYLNFIISMAGVSIDYELKLKYIFILPGAPWKKILALNIVPLIKSFFLLSCALIPVGIIFRVPLYSLLAGLIFPISMGILNLFSSVIIHILIPNNFDMKAFFPLIRIFSFLLFLVPPGIAGVAIGIITKDIGLVFYTISIINIAMSVLFLGISDRVFGRLEIR